MVLANRIYGFPLFDQQNSLASLLELVVDDISQPRAFSNCNEALQTALCLLFRLSLETPHKRLCNTHLYTGKNLNVLESNALEKVVLLRRVQV